MLYQWYVNSISQLDFKFIIKVKDDVDTQLNNEAYILLQWKRSYTDYLFITKPLSPMQFPTVVKQQRQQQDDNMYERKKDEKK